MNCREAELRIARSLEEGLGPAESEALGRHLAGCYACSRLEQELRADQEALRELDAGVTEDAVFELHARVMAKLPRRRPWLWPLAIAASVLVAVFSAALMRWPPVPPPPSAPVAKMRPPDNLPQPRPPAAPLVAARKSVRVQHRQPVRQAPAGPLMVKLETADPNVVIYWIVEQTGESE